MNKKVASLLFAIAAAASVTTALAGPPTGPTCQWTCKLEYEACLDNGGDPLQCLDDRMQCTGGRCGI